MGKNVKKFVSREFIKTVDLDLLRRLIQPFQDKLKFDWGSLPEDERERREALFEFFRSADEQFPSELLDALHCILVLSNPNGVRILQELAEANEVELIAAIETEGESDGRHLTPKHIALRAYLEHREIFNRALDIHAFWAAPSPMEFVGNREDVPSRHEDEAARSAFAKGASEYFSKRYLGRYCDVRWYPDGDEINILVLHGKNATIANVEQAGEEHTLGFREIVQDTIRYHAPSGRVRTSAQTAGEKKKLAELFAEHLLGDPEFFSGQDAQRLYTLKRIQDAGADYRFSFEWDEDIENVVVKEVQVDEGEHIVDGKRRFPPWGLTVRDNRNAVARLLDLAPHIDLSELRINYVKFEFRFAMNGRRSRAIVKVKPPDVASFRDHALEEKIMEHLTRNGIRIARPADAASIAAE